MEEDEFRRTYHQVNPERCQFEKTILARRAGCQLAQRFNLGEREGVACTHPLAQQRCQLVLQQLRNNALFALGITRLDGPLPHAKEVKVQTGGLLGLQRLIHPDMANNTIADIHQLLEDTRQHYPQVDALPYTELARSIVKFEGRPNRKK